MKITLIVEGKTETAFTPHLRTFLQEKLKGRMPALDPLPYDGRIPTGDKLKRVVKRLLNSRHQPADQVIALTDVYTGTQPPNFRSAADAKNQMRQWVGSEPRFHPHAAQYDFESGVLPYWPTIQRLAGHNKSPPSGTPETVNHNNPPAYRIKEIFSIGSCRKHYVKPWDAGRILKNNDLSIAVYQCPELKAFINTILSSCGGATIP